MDERTHVIGRAKTVLVFNSTKAVISEILAHGMKQQASGKRLCFCGTVKFSDPVRKHIRHTLLPIIDRILEKLKLPQKNFEVSAVNLGAASALDVGVTVSGLSADVPVFIAILSQALRVSISDDFVATGHIASVEGDIGAVKGIPAKVEAAKADDSIRRFIYPNLEKDESLKVLSPNERERSIDSIMAARDSICTQAVGGIGQLVREVFTEESIVLAGLREDFFGISKTQGKSSNPVSNAVSFLTDNNEKRFWNILQRHFMAGECEKGKELLRAFVHFFITRQMYPTALGIRLFQLICSLPPAVRKLKMDFPILNTGLCIKLGQFARENDYADVSILFEAAHGKNIVLKAEICLVNEPLEIKTSDSDCILFDMITSQINEQTLAQKVGIPIDSARGSYILDSSTIQTYEQFIDTLQAFYIHLQRYIGSSPVQHPDITKARSETIALLERAFYSKGGDRGAFARGREGTGGGMRSVLDVLTEQCKTEKKAAYIQRVFKDAITAMDWDERVRFMRGAMKRLGPFLPPEFRNEPPERFARDYEKIVRTYVESFDRVTQLLRTM